MRNYRYYYSLLVVLCGLALCGCGGSDPNTFSPNSGVVGQRPNLFGYVVLDGVREQATLEAFVPSSATAVWTGQTDRGGAFVIPTAPLGQEFRLRATPAGEEPLLLDVRIPDSASTPLLLCPNYISSIAAYYRDTHPEVSVVEARRRIKTALGIPVELNTNLIADGPHSPFSHSYFRQRATAVGGTAALQQQVAQQADSRVQSFRNPSFYPTLRKSLVPLAATIQPGVPLQAADVLDSLWDSVTSNMLSNPLNLAEGDFLGWICGLCGWNVGTSGALAQIQMELTEVLSDLTALTKAVSVGFSNQTFSSLQQSLQDDVTSANTITTQLQGVVSAISATRPASSTTVDYGPAAIPSDLGTLVQALNQQTLSNSVSEVQGALSSTDVDQNIVLAFNQLYSNQQIDSATPPPSTLYYDARYNTATTVLQAQLDFYRSQLLLLAQALAENAHASILPQPISAGYNPPATPITQANQLVQGAAQANQQAQGYVPQPFDFDQLFMDVPANLMWYTCISPPSVDYQQWLNALNDTEYTGWRLPQESEFPVLYNRLVAGGRNWYDGFDQFGFTGYVNYGGDDGFYIRIGSSDGGISGDWFDFATGNVNKLNFDDDRYMAVRNVNTVTSQYGDTALRRVTQSGIQLTGDTLTVTQSGNQMSCQVSNTQDANPAAQAGDISPLVYWTTSDPTVVTVSNAPGTLGQLTWIGSGGTATIKASYFQGPGLTLTDSVQVTNTSSKTLSSIWLAPYNTEYQVNPTAQQFYLTGVYSDGTIADLTQTSGVTWAVSPTTVGQFNQAGTMGVLNYGTITTSNATATVTSTYQGLNATANIQLAVP